MIPSEIVSSPFLYSTVHCITLQYSTLLHIQIFLSKIETFCHLIESSQHETLVNLYSYLLLKHFESIAERMLGAEGINKHGKTLLSHLSIWFDTGLSLVNMFLYLYIIGQYAFLIFSPFSYFVIKRWEDDQYFVIFYHLKYREH